MKGLKLAVTLVVLGSSFYSAKADAQNFQNPNQLAAQVSPLQEKPQIRDSQLKAAKTSGNSFSVETQLSQGYDLLNKKEAAILDLNQAVSLFKAQGKSELAKKAQDMIEKFRLARTISH